MILSTLLKPTDRDQLQRIFPALDLATITIELRDKDGPGGVIGWVPGSLWEPDRVILIDDSDLRLEGGFIDFSDPVMLEMMAHELTHLEQGLRGFWYRLKMWFWRKFYSYEKRPHEIEAYAKGREIALNYQN